MTPNKSANNIQRAAFLQFEDRISGTKERISQ